MNSTKLFNMIVSLNALTANLKDLVEELVEEERKETDSKAELALPQDKTTSYYSTPTHNNPEAKKMVEAAGMVNQAAFSGEVKAQVKAETLHKMQSVEDSLDSSQKDGRKVGPPSYYRMAVKEAISRIKLGAWLKTGKNEPMLDRHFIDIMYSACNAGTATIVSEMYNMRRKLSVGANPCTYYPRLNTNNALASFAQGKTIVFAKKDSVAYKHGWFSQQIYLTDLSPDQAKERDPDFACVMVATSKQTLLLSKLWWAYKAAKLFAKHINPGDAELERLAKKTFREIEAELWATV